MKIKPFYMHSYKQEHVNHLNDTAKNWPVNIPWDINVWNNDQTLKSVAQTITGSLIRDIRQHAKALEKNFNFVDEDPSYAAVSDAETAIGDPVDADEYKNPGGGGLIDGLEAKGIEPGSVSAGQKIDKSILNNIAQGLEEKSKYNNYSNRVNSGYNKYSNYSKHSVHTQHNQAYYYRKWLHKNYSYKNKHSNTSAHTNVYGDYLNNSVTHPNLLSYQDTFNNPAVYQNTL